MAYKLFSTGEVLTAANVNNYLMKQTVMVFASAAARTTALSGVLAEGMISYRTDAHILEVYNGTAWIPSDTQLTTKGDLAVYSTAPDRLAVGADGSTLVANSANASGLGWTQTLDLKSPREISTISATAATGTINFDIATQGVLYYTTNASANFTLNFRGNSTTTLNSIMAIGDSQSAVFLNTNGATAYYANAFQIDGTSVTPKWSGGTAPSAGNASAIDAWTFTIIKTGSAAYTVLAGGATKFA